MTGRARAGPGERKGELSDVTGQGLGERKGELSDVTGRARASGRAS